MSKKKQSMFSDPHYKPSGIVEILPDGSARSVVFENGKIRELGSSYTPASKQKSEIKEYHVPNPNDFLRDKFDVDNLIHYWEQEHIYPEGSEVTKWRNKCRTSHIRDYFDSEVNAYRFVYQGDSNQKDVREKSNVVSSKDKITVKTSDLEMLPNAMKKRVEISLPVSPFNKKNKKEEYKRRKEEYKKRIIEKAVVPQKRVSRKEDLKSVAIVLDTTNKKVV